MQMPIPDDWDGESFCRWAVCWPDSDKWRAILYGLIENPNQGRFWDFDTGNFLELRGQFKTAYDYNFVLREVIMACGDTGLSEGLLAIAEAIRAAGGGSSCCEQEIIAQGGGVVASFTQPSTEETWPIFGTETPLSIAPGEWPEGFDDLAEYEADKCEVANLILDGLIGTLRGLGALGVFNYAALAGLVILAVTGAIVFPPAFVPIACALLGVLSVGVTVLAVAADAIEDARAEWVCALYEAESVQAALGVVADLIDAVVATLSLDAGRGLIVKQLILLLVNGDTLNQLFEKTAHLVYEGADCSGCVCDDFWVAQGTLDGTDLIGQVGPAPYAYTAILYVNYSEPSGPYCGPAINYSFTHTGWTPGDPQNESVQIYDQAGNTLYASDTFPGSEEYCIGAVAFYSDTPFTIHLAAGGECGGQ